MTITVTDIPVEKMLTWWASKKLSLFLIFKLSEGSGGSARCVIEDFSSEVLRLSWAGETDLNRRGEFILALKGASLTTSNIEVGELVSGSDFIDPNEPFVRITLPSGNTFWLVMMRPSELDEAILRDEELSSGRIAGLTHEEAMRAAKGALSLLSTE